MSTSKECERRGAGLGSDAETGCLLQPVLGADKRNPLLTVFQPGKDRSGPLHVYYGAELLEIIPGEKTHPAFKLLVGRLYNAGIKGCRLQAAFGVDRKTMQRWGRGLRSEDPEALVRALAGRGGHRKLTPQIRSFIAVRFPEIYGRSRRGYSGRIRAEVREVFGVELSAECVRPLFGRLKAELRDELDELAGEKRETPCDSASEKAADREVGTVPEPEVRCPNPKESPVSAPSPAEPSAHWCHHLGVLLFSPLLLALSAEFAPEGWLLRQWLASLLSGAVNIEQTKLLDFDDLKQLLGRTLRTLFPQRVQLGQLAAPQTVSRLLAFNARQVDLSQERDFYFDPHTKHYTGRQPILKADFLSGFLQ